MTRYVQGTLAFPGFSRSRIEGLHSLSVIDEDATHLQENSPTRWQKCLGLPGNGSRASTRDSEEILAAGLYNLYNSSRL